MLLQCTGLTKRFGGITALDGVDFEVAEGEIHALIGPNGSGKSTLLAIVSGAQQPDSGELVVDGGSFSSFRSPRVARSHGIERMPQEIAVVPTMSVLDNMIMGREPRRMAFIRSAESRRVAAQALERVGLDINLDCSVADLRPSQQRMIMLARSLARSVRLLIVDEPTAGLTHEESDEVVGAVSRAAESGISIVYVSHHLDEVAGLANRTTVLRTGKVVQRFAQRAERSELIHSILGDVRSPAEDIVRQKPGEVLLRVRDVGAGPLRKLSLQARRHEVVGIAGLLGSGRDEVLSALAGCVDRTGYVGTPRHEITSPHSWARAGIGFASGDRSKAVVADMPVGQQVSLPVIKRFRTAGFVRESVEGRAVENALRSVGVTSAVTQPLNTLSGGNQQRALLARWLLADVEVLLIDEPSLGVDIGARADLLVQIQAFAARGAVVVSSSEVADLTDICDRIICLRKGHVSAELKRADGWERAIAEATV